MIDPVTLIFGLAVQRGGARSDCWERLYLCPYEFYKYECEGHEYEAHLKEQPCPTITEPIVPSNSRTLFYGPSYLRQIANAIICVHYVAGFVLGSNAEELHGFNMSREHTTPELEVRFVNNATLTVIINHPELQRSDFVFEGKLAQFLVEKNFTTAVFMETHPDCFFDHDICVPTGTGVVQNRGPSYPELLHQCAARHTLADFFSKNRRTWTHLIAWTGLFTHVKFNADSCIDHLIYDAGKDVPIPDVSSLNLQSDIQRFPCSASIGHNCTASCAGHQCAPGHITNVALLRAKHDIWPSSIF